MTKAIQWVRWVDPLEPFLEDEKVESEEDDDDPAFAKSRDSFKLRKTMRNNKSKGGPSIVGPMGVIPLLESNLPSVLYNFWMGDTNFNIGDRFMFELEHTEGIETLDVFTRYRFRVGIGRAFEEMKVMRTIDAMLAVPAYIPKEGGPTPKLLSKAFPAWALVEREDGSKTAVGGATPEEVLAKIGEGRIVKSSWEKR